ncbi:unnamed protein product, partial [Polarella glacialis]
ALHGAAAEGRYEVAVCLVEELKAEVHVRDRWGSTPLDDARFGGHEDLASYLVSKGAVSGNLHPASVEGSSLVPSVPSFSKPPRLTGADVKGPFACCLPRRHFVRGNKELVAGEPASLHLHLAEPIEPSTCITVSLEGPMKLKALLPDRQVPTDCIEVRFTLRLSGCYEFQAQDDSGAVCFTESLYVAKPAGTQHL